MEEKLRLTYLYDFYGELLKPEQKELFAAFVFDDLSLGEIAEEAGVSRQAVHDKVRRCVHAMEQYEGRLHLIEKNERLMRGIEAIRRELADVFDEDARQRLEATLRDMSEVL